MNRALRLSRCVTRLTNAPGVSKNNNLISGRTTTPQVRRVGFTGSRPSSSVADVVDEVEVELRERSPEELEEAELGIVDWPEVLSTMKQIEEMPWNNRVGSEMVVGLGKMKRLEEAQEAFELTLAKQVDRPNTYLLNAMLSACNRCGAPAKALELFRENTLPRGLGFKPNRDTYRAVLIACGKMGDGATALELFKEAQAAGFKPESQACHAALRALDTAGDAEGRRAVEEAMGALGIPVKQ